MGKRIINFFDYMMDYPHQFPDRIALAAELRRLATYHEEIKEIDSLMDLMIVSREIESGPAFEAASGSLWCEYCAATGHPMD